MGTRFRSVFKEKFKGVWAGGELGGFRCPGWEVEGRTAWISNDLSCVKQEPGDSLKTSKLVKKNIPKLVKIVPQPKLGCSFCRH